MTSDDRMFLPAQITEMNMSELCLTAHQRNWDVETMQAWSTFKIAQYLEKIAAQGRIRNE